MRRYGLICFAAPLAVALLLSGCGSLLGGGKPVDLYRFATPPAVAPAGVSGVLPRSTRTLLVMPVRFAAEIDGDKVLAAQGQKTLYIKGMRWAAPAPVLFAQALTAGFTARVPDVAVVDRRTGANADASLQISIDRFEAQYNGDILAAPIVVIEGRATLIDAKTNLPVGSYRLTATARASANNAAEIAAAFDRANTIAVTGAVDWVAATIGARPVAVVPGSVQAVGKK